VFEKKWESTTKDFSLVEKRTAMRMVDFHQGGR
jgi:hypothetical protein